LKLAEPVTSFTDFILAAELFLFAALLFASSTGQYSVALWATAMASLGLSAVTGGIYHGLAPYLNASNLQLLWRTTAVAIITTAELMTLAGLTASLSGILRAALMLITVIPFCAFLTMACKKRDNSVKLHSSRSIIPTVLAILLLLLIRQILAKGADSGILILTGALITFAGIWVQQAQITVHKNFNHNDLCHIFFMAGMYFLYRGGLLLRDH